MPELTASDYERLVRSLRYCVLVHDAVTKDILWANPAAAELLEFSVEELRPLKAPDMSARERRYRRSVGRQWLQDAADNGVAVTEWAYRAKSGRVILTEAIAIRVELSARPVVMVQFRDIEHEALMRSNLVRTEADLTRTEARLAAFLRSMSEGILVLDDDGLITYASEAAAALLDSSVDDLVGAQFINFCRPGESRQSVQAALGRTARHGEPESIRYELALPSGRVRWHSGSCQHIEIENDLSGSLLLCHDVTEHVLTEQAHRRDAQYLNHLARYNAMGDMAMAIAHELAQPLAAATNYLAGTQSRLGDSQSGQEDIHRGLEHARRQLDRANNIVRSLREYVTTLEESQQHTDLNDIVAECAYFIDLRARERGVIVQYAPAEDPVEVVCERVLTGQVVLNLCFNAIEEMAEWPAEQRMVSVAVRRERDFGVFTVTDRGKGLSHMPSGRIFDGAFTDKSTGHGIGLALSHRIITRQGGTLSARENFPRGAVFEFHLPLGDDPDPTGQNA
ncbi:PAS domain S-box protein [Williamsia muralis]|uniref:histidine kinase n=1 Tax=Williamsia marianensis TaxID=85044 RepID=A0ABU4ETV7_WILMA|nr:PAS domain S-box protein [Williamsia muralis]MDV7134683.1 PAS domain S-box protein [Williamsia muralis]